MFYVLCWGVSYHMHRVPVLVSVSVSVGLGKMEDKDTGTDKRALVEEERLERSGVWCFILIRH